LSVPLNVGAGGDRPAVLQHETECLIVPGAERRRHHSSRPKGRVERAVNLVADKREIVVRTVRGASGGNQPAVRLRHECAGNATGSDGRDHLPARPESHVE
jgi:hypothetical protein